MTKRLIYSDLLISYTVKVNKLKVFRLKKKKNFYKCGQIVKVYQVIFFISKVDALNLWEVEENVAKLLGLVFHLIYVIPIEIYILHLLKELGKGQMLFSH